MKNDSKIYFDKKALDFPLNELIEIKDSNAYKKRNI